MKGLVCAAFLSFTVTVGAQTVPPTTKGRTSADLPTTLPELTAVLPVLVHSQQLQFATYSHAWWAALQKNPDAAPAAIPLISRDLQDPDQDVVFYTLALLQGLAIRPDYAELVAPLNRQLASEISSGGENAKRMALLDVQSLRQKAPDAVISSVEQLLASRPQSDTLLFASAETLMATRPIDDRAQEMVLAAINDADLTTEQRQALLRQTSLFGVGRKLEGNVIRLARSSTDKTWRDAAIVGADKIGPDALTQISDVLRKITNDPRESPISRQVARHALNELASADK